MEGHARNATAQYISSAYQKTHTCSQHHIALTGGVTYGDPDQVAALRRRDSERGVVPGSGIVPDRRTVRRSGLWVAVVVVGVTVAGCAGGSTVGSQATTPVGSHSTTTAARAAGPASAGTSPLAEALAYSQCIRSHGVSNFPDPVQTPDGGYGYRTKGIDPNSGTFQAALQACKALPSPWSSAGQQLSSAQQQAWLNWAQCIRTHGEPDFPDPTFSGSEVHDPSVASNSPQLQPAMETCQSQEPSVGGLGG